MYKELAQLIFDKAIECYDLDDSTFFRIEGLHVICEERLDLLIEGYIHSKGSMIYPMDEKPYFVESKTEIEVTLCDAFYTNQDQKFIDLCTIQDEVNKF